MGTQWMVRIVNNDESLAHIPATKQGLQNILDQIEHSMSNWIGDSEVSRFNRYPAGCMSISALTREVIQLGLAVSEASEGYFDPTLEPLVDAWGFGVSDTGGRVPSAIEIQKAQQNTGYQSVHLKGDSLCKNNANTRLNLSAIAKGYAVDQLATYLQDSGHRRFLVEVGGELYGLGTNQHGQVWRVGIERPGYTMNRELQDRVQLSGMGIATSGDYRNYYEHNGQRYSHILNPRTGYPVRHQAASATVLSANTAVADAWATALLAAGPEEGIRIANQADIAAMILVHSGEAFEPLFSQNWPQTFRITGNGNRTEHSPEFFTK